MCTRSTLVAVLTTLASVAHAAPPVFMTVDQSNDQLIDKAAVAAVWKAAIPADRLARLYKPSQWGFASEVEGGFTSSGTCVVSARAMMMPVLRGTMQFAPSRKSVVFDAQPGLSKAQCSDLAAASLKEAVQSVMSGLMK